MSERRQRLIFMNVRYYPKGKGPPDSGPHRERGRTPPMGRPCPLPVEPRAEPQAERRLVRGRRRRAAVHRLTEVRFQRADGGLVEVVVPRRGAAVEQVERVG